MVPFIVLKTREEALTGLLWEKVGEEGEFGFVLVEFYLGTGKGCSPTGADAHLSALTMVSCSGAYQTPCP